MFKIGDELFFVPGKNVSYLGGKRKVTIKKIGSRYIYFSSESFRVGINDLSIDGDGFSPGKCYISEAEFNEQEEKYIMWNTMKNKINSEIPSCITKEKIQAAMNMLFG